MLWSAGLPPPKQIFCHGYLTVKGQKISKSLPATKVDPNAIADELGVDPLRYFVLREYTLGARRRLHATRRCSSATSPTSATTSATC